MTKVLDLVDMISDDSELVPEIIPVDARLRITSTATALRNIFSRAVSVVPDREIIPNTSFVRIEAFDYQNGKVSYIEVSATDGDRFVSLTDDSVKVSLPGAALLPGKKVLEILKLAPEEIVHLNVTGNTATIRSAQAIWSVQTPVGDYLPPFPEMEDVKFYTVSVHEMRSALIHARKSVSSSSARLSLMQAKFSKSHLVSCDGARVHKIRIPTLSKNIDTTIPASFMDVIIRELSTTGSDDFEFGYNLHTVIVKIDNNSLSGQKLNLKYPDVEQLMIEPALYNTETLEVNRSGLYSAIKRVKVNSDPESSALTLSIRLLKGEWTATIRAKDKAGNASQESLSVSFSGEGSKEITVNHKYLLELLECVNGEYISFLLGPNDKKKKSPLYVKTDSFVGVLTPMVPFS